MANEFKFCRFCGKQISQSAKFCRHCGADLSNISVQNAQPRPASGNPTPAPAAAPQPPRRKRKAWKVIVAVTLVATLLFTAFLKPGFLRRKPGGDGGFGQNASGQDGSGYDKDIRAIAEKTSIKSDFKTEPVAKGTLTLENRTLSEGNVSVTVEEGFLGEDRDIEVNKVTEKVEYSFDGEEVVPLTAYEVNIDGIHEGSMITIELPMDKKAAPLYGAGYIDEEEHILKPALNEYNPDTGILTIHTTHLSIFCGIPIENETSKNAKLAYVSGYDLIDSREILDYHALMDALEESLKGDGNIECGMNVLDKLSLIQGSGNVTTDLITTPLGENIAKGGDGAGHIIIMGGNRGTIGEIMNTNWGKSGSLSLTAESGKTATEFVGYDQKLKSVYPGKVVSKIGSGLTWAGRFLTLLKITNNIREEGWTAKSTGSEALKWAASETLSIVAKNYAPTAALGIYLVGVAALGLTIDYVYNEAASGRKEVYIHAYNKYYSSKEGHRTDDQWIAIFKDIMKDGGGQKEFNAEIDKYVNQFWVEADNISVDYLASVLTPDDRAAWGVEAGAGLNAKIRKDISDNYKARLVTKRMPKIFDELSLQTQWELAEKYEAQVDDLRKLWNQTITLTIDTAEELEDEDGKKKESFFSGCTVRFKDLKGKVNNPKEWETVLNKDGKGSIKFTLLAHMIANAGTEIEVVRTKGGSEEVLLTDTFVFQEDWGYSFSKLYAAYTIKDIPEEEEPLGDFPSLSIDMTVKNSLNLAYDAPAHFNLKPDGQFSLSLPALSVTDTPYSQVHVIKSKAYWYKIDAYSYEGNLASYMRKTAEENHIELYSRDIHMDSTINFSGSYHEIWYPDDENSFEDNRQDSGTYRMIKEYDATADQDLYYSGIELILDANPEPGTGGKLTVRTNAVFEEHMDSYSERYQTDDSFDDQTHLPGWFEVDIDEKTLEEFRTCFPPE